MRFMQPQVDLSGSMIIQDQSLSFELLLRDNAADWVNDTFPSPPTFDDTESETEEEREPLTPERNGKPKGKHRQTFLCVKLECKLYLRFSNSTPHCRTPPDTL